MRNALNLLKWTATLGSEPQNFLGAKWIPGFLKRLPENKKRKWALRFVSFSPHYFLEADSPRYAGLKTDDYLERAYADLSESRVSIRRDILGKYFDPSNVVAEYGCGPGFLAKAVSPYVKKLYGIDISRGALACASIINTAENIEYISILDGDLRNIEANSLDAVYSFAVVQHLTDEVLETVLANCAEKLRPGGKLVLHIQLEDDVWKTEEEWKSDDSVKGKIKYKYALHCFARSKKDHVEMVSKFGFSDIAIEYLQDILDNPSPEQLSQAILSCKLSG